jgi:hypothetical protein
LAAVAIFLVSLYVYASGAFSYPYLEDDDPWAHAASAKYVSMEKTVYTSPYRSFNYLDPYPPGYAGVMGVLHQTNDSVYFTLKFFNALIISLGILFFFFFAREFTGNSSKALFATFVFASLPSYLSHFIWAHALVVTLFFPAVYCLERIKYDRRWLFPAAAVIAGFMAVQPTQMIKLLVLIGIYVSVKSVAEKKILIHQAAAVLLGVFLSLSWWALKARSFFGLTESIGGTVAGAAASADVNIFQKVFLILQGIFPAASGTATRAYTFSDFFIAQKQNMINNPIGIGIVISLLAVIGLVVIALKYKSLLQQKNTYLLIALLWLFFTFLGVNSITFNLPFGLFAFRFWMLLAIPVAILAAEGAWFLAAVAKNFNIPKLAIITVIAVGILFTSGIQKYSVNTAQWPPGAFWGSIDELQGYIWLKTLPPNTKVFSFFTDDQVIGFDKFSCGWCKDEAELRKGELNITAQELHQWLLSHGYKYFIFGGMEANRFGYNETTKLLNDIQSSQLFSVAHQTRGVVILKTS